MNFRDLYVLLTPLETIRHSYSGLVTLLTYFPVSCQDAYQTLERERSNPRVDRSPLPSHLLTQPQPSPLRLQHSGAMPYDCVGRTLRIFSDMDYMQLAALGGAAAALTHAIYRRYSGISLDDVPGPENPSFLHGTPHSFKFSILLPPQRAHG